MCNETIPEEHSHVVESGEPGADVHLPALLPALHRAGRRRAASSPRCPTATSTTPTSRLSNAQWDQLQIPVKMAFFFVNSEHGQDGRLLSQPGRRHGVAAARSTRGTRSWPPTRCSSLEPDVEALLVYRRQDDTLRVLPGPDRRLLRARRATCGSTGRASTAARRPGKPSTASSTASGARSRSAGRCPQRRSRERARLRLRRRQADPYAVAPTLDLPPAGGRDHRASRRTASPCACQIRIEPLKRRYSDSRGRPPRSTSSGSAPAGATP